MNSIAAALLFVAVFRLSRSMWYRVWIGVLAATVALFAITSTTHFLEIATNIRLPLLWTLISNEGILVVYLILLPLQAVSFLLLLITLWVLRRVRMKQGGDIPPRTLFRSFALFFVMALLALGDLGIVLSGMIVAKLTPVPY